MNHIRIAVCSIVLLILAGCKGGKELISERPVSQEVRNNFESLMASYPDWNTFSAKGSADLSFGASGSLSASTQLRMVRGEVLQISVRIILGIEVARLYMTPDSLFLVNKMQKQYVAASLQEIGERLSCRFGESDQREEPDSITSKSSIPYALFALFNKNMRPNNAS